MKNKKVSKTKVSKIGSTHGMKPEVEIGPDRVVEVEIPPKKKVKVEGICTTKICVGGGEETDCSSYGNKTNNGGSEGPSIKPASTLQRSRTAAQSHIISNEVPYRAPYGGTKVSKKSEVKPSTMSVQNHIELKPRPNIPKWFPPRIRRILKDKSCPEALPFKSIGRITHYRAWLEQLRHRRWKRYIAAGKRRWQLVVVLRKLRSRGMTTKAIFQYRVRQHNMWKDRAFTAMVALDQLVNGIKTLDEIIFVIFANEREVYEDDLDRKNRGLPF